MASDLTVVLDDRPGALADMGEALGRAGVNIEGLSGVAGGGRSPIHILVQDADVARSALGEAGIEVGDVAEVVMLDFQDRPGELGEMARRVADTGANIDVVYVSCDGRLVMVTDDNDAVAGLS